MSHTAYFYLCCCSLGCRWKRSPGKQGSHYDPECDLFTPGERNLVGLL